MIPVKYFTKMKFIGLLIFLSHISLETLGFASTTDVNQEKLIKVQAKPLVQVHSTIQSGVCLSFIEELNNEDHHGVSENLDQEKAVQHMEQELIETKEELQNTIEELEMATSKSKYFSSGKLESTSVQFVPLSLVTHRPPVRKETKCFAVLVGSILFKKT